ncbi:CdiA C-terminal domain-containing protein [Paenibacillus kobensis]|uniref:CdiA C-terminal domain-containing protein n=1 Tax=Paenibacillus kobensis TaxID=59841 RepID=UPI003898F1B0
MKGKYLIVILLNQPHHQENISSSIQGKVQSGQTDRVVLNLSDWQGDVNTLKKQLSDWPIAGLKEVIAVDSKGNVTNIFP